MFVKWIKILRDATLGTGTNEKCWRLLCYAGIVLYDAVLIARRCCTGEVAFYAATADDIPAARS